MAYLDIYKGGATKSIVPLSTSDISTSAFPYINKFLKVKKGSYYNSYTAVKHSYNHPNPSGLRVQADGIEYDIISGSPLVDDGVLGSAPHFAWYGLGATFDVNAYYEPRTVIYSSLEPISKFYTYHLSGQTMKYRMQVEFKLTCKIATHVYGFVRIQYTDEHGAFRQIDSDIYDAGWPAAAQGTVNFSDVFPANNYATVQIIAYGTIAGSNYVHIYKPT